MAAIKNTFESASYGDRLEPADRLRLEHHVYFQDEKTDISRLTVLPLERLQELREQSAAAEQAIFDSLREQAGAWDNQAAVTLLIDKAIEYSKVPAVVHSSNKWVKDNVNSDRQSISNMVYKMAYHINERTLGRTAQGNKPVAYEVTWDVFTNAPNSRSGYNNRQKIAGQYQKSFADKASMEKYLAGRIKAYEHLFTEISPPIPPEYKKGFSVNGLLLPGYTVQGEKPPDRAADLADGGVSVVDQKLNDLLRKEQNDMNEPLNIKLSTREQYEAGSVEGAWLKLPATHEQLNAALARIGAQGKDFVISGIETPIAAVSRLPLENVQKAGLDELNFLAAGLEKLDDTQIVKLNVIAENVTFGDNLHSLLEHAHNTDFYEHYPEIKTYAELGEHIFEHSGLIQIPDYWAAAVDREKLGMIAVEKERGTLDEHGYLVESGMDGAEWKPVTEIPQEYRIAPKIENPDIEQDTITTRTAATVTAKPPEQAKPAAAFMPIVLTSDNPRDRLKEITDKLEAGIKGIFDSEKYKDYLQTLSKFHNYSFNNCILIAMQKPDASHVAGFNDWRDNFKRQVKKGEKGIKILAPAPFKTKKMIDAVSADGKPIFDNDGRRKKEEKEITVPAFKIVSVFDVSQTDGEPLPQIGVDELTGNVDKYKELFAALEKTSPVPVSFEALAPGVKGTYFQIDKRIAVNEGMSELQNLKTLVHEIVHARLHDIDKNAPANEPRPDRDTREVQAESIAYTVCQHYGLDTSGYSFGYVAEWSGGKELDLLKNSLDTIRKEASAIITEVDKHFAELTQGKEQTAERQPGFETWSEPATPDNAPDNPGAPSDDVNKYLSQQPAQEKTEPEQTEPQGDSFTIYQLKGGDETRDLRFAELAAVTAAGLSVALANYDKVYTAPLDNTATLEDIYFTFNMDRPEDFTGHSLSISDVVVMNRDGKETAFYVGGTEYTELPGFLAQQAQEKPAPAIDLKTVADYMQKQYEYAQSKDPNNQTADATVSIITRRLENASQRIPDTYPQLKALITLAAQSPDLATLKERMNTMHSEFIQHYSTAVQNTVDMSGKAEPTKPAPTATVKQNDTPPAPKAPAQGENVAAIEAKVKAGEAINLSDLNEAMIKDKAAARTAPQTGQTRTAPQGKATPKSEQPSIKDKIAAGREEIAGKKSTPAKAQNKNAGLGE